MRWCASQSIRMSACFGSACWPQGLLLLGYGSFLNLAPVDFGRVVGLYIATLFVVWQVINFIFFRAIPSVPIWSEHLDRAGWLLVTYWKPADERFVSCKVHCHTYCKVGSTWKAGHVVGGDSSDSGSEQPLAGIADCRAGRLPDHENVAQKHFLVLPTRTASPGTRSALPSAA